MQFADDICDGDDYRLFPYICLPITIAMSATTNIFIAYDHTDANYCEELR